MISVYSRAMKILLICWLFGPVCCEFWLQILHTNDLHARFDETDVHGASCTDDLSIRNQCYGGFARLKRAIDVAVEEANAVDIPSINLNGGDTFEACNGTSVQWQIVAKFVDHMEFDAMALGNHEFQDGVDDLVSYLKSIRTPAVCCNLNKTADRRLDLPVLKPSRVLTVRDRKIGIIGYVTPRATQMVDNKDLILSEVPCVRAEARRLKANGVDIIIALGHSGFAVDQQIAAAVEEVSLVVGGHSHVLLYNPPNKGPSIEVPAFSYPTIVTQKSGRMVPVVQAFAYSKYLGKLLVRFDDDGGVLTASGNPLLLDGSIAKDPQIDDHVSEWSDSIKQLYSWFKVYTRRPIFKLNFRLGRLELNRRIMAESHS